MNECKIFMDSEITVGRMIEILSNMPSDYKLSFVVVDGGETDFNFDFLDEEAPEYTTQMFMEFLP